MKKLVFGGRLEIEDQIVNDTGVAGTERLKLKNAQLREASIAHLVAILHGKVPM